MSDPEGRRRCQRSNVRQGQEYALQRARDRASGPRAGTLGQRRLRDVGLTHHKRLHHGATPKRYLQNFSIPGKSYIWVFTRGKSYRPGTKKGRDNPYTGGLRVTGAGLDRHTIVTDSGDVEFNRYEDAFRKIETAADPIWPMLAAKAALTSAEKQVLTRYICHLLKRTDRRMERVKPLYEESVSDVRFEQYSNALAAQGRFTDAINVRKQAAYLRSDEGRKAMRLELARLPYLRLEAALFSLPWVFRLAPPEWST